MTNKYLEKIAKQTEPKSNLRAAGRAGLTGLGGNIVGGTVAEYIARAAKADPRTKAIAGGFGSGAGMAAGVISGWKASLRNQQKEQAKK